MRFSGRFAVTAAMMYINAGCYKKSVEQEAPEVGARGVEAPSSLTAKVIDRIENEESRTEQIKKELRKIVDHEVRVHWDDSSVEAVEKNRDKLLLKIRGVCMDSKGIDAYCGSAKEAVMKKSEAVLKSIKLRQPEVQKPMIELSYHDSLPDPRPRVKVQFQLNNQPTVFSLMFDTGSGRSFILRVDVAGAHKCEEGPPCRGNREKPIVNAQNGEGYLDDGKGLQLAGSCELKFGHEECNKALPVLKTVKELVKMIGEKDSFEYTTGIDLVNDILNSVIGVGLLGASHDSPFAMKAGVFTYIGPPTDYKFGASKDAGKLIIGDRDFDRISNEHCSGALGFFPNTAGIGLWNVDGSVTSGVSGLSEPMKWLVDTGATNYFVTEKFYEEVVSQLTAKGATVGRRNGLLRAMVMNCPLTTDPITFNIGSGPGKISVQVNDYLSNRIPELGVCILELDPADLYIPGARLMGMGLLSKLVTVFDHENERMGFCLHRK
jgi:hypothetical protein